MNYELRAGAIGANNPPLKLIAQLPDISIGLGLPGFELVILDLKRNVKLKHKDHRRLMEVEQSNKKQKVLTIEKEITPVRRLAVLLLGPGILVGLFWAVFIIENEGLPAGSNMIDVLGGCILKMLTQGNAECLPDPGYIILCTILGGPFAFFITYKIWQDLKTKVILTDQKIIKKQPSGKEIQLYWSEIKKVRIISVDAGSQLIFTRNKGSALFNDSKRIFCPPNLNKERPFLSRDAANLILKKIDRYNISVKGNRELLEVIIITPHKPQQGPTSPIAQNLTTRNRLPLKPSPTPTQKPTPK